MLENESLHDREDPNPPPPPPLLGKRMHLLFLALPVTNGPLPTELKFIGTTLQFVDVRLIEVASKVQACFSGNVGRNVEIILLLNRRCPLNMGFAYYWVST